MSNSVSLNRTAFKQGVDEVLTLKPLRDAASLAFGRHSAKKAQSGVSPSDKPHSVVVVRGGSSVWHVKRAS